MRVAPCCTEWSAAGDSAAVRALLPPLPPCSHDRCQSSHQEGRLPKGIDHGSGLGQHMSHPQSRPRGEAAASTVARNEWQVIRPPQLTPRRLRGWHHRGQPLSLQWQVSTRPGVPQHLDPSLDRPGWLRRRRQARISWGKASIPIIHTGPLPMLALLRWSRASPSCICRQARSRPLWLRTTPPLRSMAPRRHCRRRRTPSNLPPGRWRA